MTKSQPNYKAIFSDIIDKKFPEKRNECSGLLVKKHLTSLDIITLNNIIFSNNNAKMECTNQKHRSYNNTDIKYILDYQKEHKLNNIQLATHFKMSRNTVSKWKKLFSK